MRANLVPLGIKLKAKCVDSGKTVIIDKYQNVNKWEQNTEYQKLYRKVQVAVFSVKRTDWHEEGAVAIPPPNEDPKIRAALEKLSKGTIEEENCETLIGGVSRDGKDIPGMDPCSLCRRVLTPRLTCPVPQDPAARQKVLEKIKGMYSI